VATFIPDQIDFKSIHTAQRKSFYNEKGVNLGHKIYLHLYLPTWTDIHFDKFNTTEPEYVKKIWTELRRQIEDFNTPLLAMDGSFRQKISK
jgi:hypothetical protein